MERGITVEDLRRAKEILDRNNALNPCNWHKELEPGEELICRGCGLVFKHNKP